MGFVLHFHLIAAISWIGGSVFLFVLGVTLRDKQDQQEVYRRIGPIYGYFELSALLILLGTGSAMIIDNGLVNILFDGGVHSEVVDALRIKLIIVAVVIVLTLIHTIISFQTLYTEKSLRQKLLSRGSSLGIFILNFLVLHYAMTIRDIL